jgi:heptosyltransferase II
MKILLITLTNIGDAILTTPVLASVVNRYPEVRFTVLVGPRAAEIFEGLPHVEKVIAYDKRMSLLRKWRLVKELRRASFDRVIDLRNTLFPLFLGARYFRSLGFLNPTHKSIHRVDQHLAHLKPLGISPRLKFLIPASEKVCTRVDKLFLKKGIDLSRDLIAISPGARSDLKRWRIHGFETVARSLARKGFSVLWVGDSSDRKLVDELMQSLEQGWFSLCGEVSLPELAEVFRRSKLVVSNDSAPMHLAQAVGARTVSIFGPTDEAKYAPRGKGHRTVRVELSCAPCEEAQCRFNHECMQDLTSERVLKTIEELLKHDPSLVS